MLKALFKISRLLVLVQSTFNTSILMYISVKVLFLYSFQDIFKVFGSCCLNLSACNSLLIIRNVLGA